MKQFLIINGPNLNLLGKRETDIYGGDSMETIRRHTQNLLKKRDCVSEWFQSNHEGEIVERIQLSLDEDYHALIINPGGYSHTSVAILDALKMVRVPVIEVHLSQIYRREDFRQSLLTAKAASKIMSGFGKDSYALAIMGELLKNED